MSLQTQVAAGFARLVTAINALAGRSLPPGGNAGQALVKSGAGDYAAAWGTVSENPALVWSRTIDCTSLQSSGIDAGYLISMSGTGAAWSGVSPSNTTQVGVARAALGTTATGRCSLLQSNTSSIRLGGGAARYICETAIVTLSDATNTYTVRYGFINSNTAESTNGCFFRYTHSVNGGRWQAVCRAAGVENAVDTGVAATAGTWLTLDIQVAADASSVAFFINGVQVATIATNIPTGSNTTGAGMMVLRSAGTTAVSALDVDIIHTQIVFTTPRW